MIIMGNSTSSNQYPQNISSSNDLQKTFSNVVKKSNTTTETINFDRNNLNSSTSDSALDMRSIELFRQTGGAYDMLSVKPVRQRYQNLESLRKNQNGGGVLQSASNHKICMSVNAFSPTSHDSKMSLNKNQSGGEIFSATSYTQASLSANKMSAGNPMPSLSKRSMSDNICKIHNQHDGGCGCGNPDENKLKISETSSQPVDYKFLKGGGTNNSEEENKKEKKDKKEKSKTKNEDEDEDKDLEDEDEDEDEKEGISDEITDEDESESSKEDSDDELEDEETSEEAKIGRSRSNEYIDTTQSGGSDSHDVRIDAKLMYSSNNSSFSSDNHYSEYFNFKNRSI